MSGGLNHYTVTIFGSSYTVISDESLESVLKAASLVDSMMQEVARKNPLLSVHIVAILVALQISHQQQKLQNAHEEDVKLCKTFVTVVDQCLQLCFNHQ
jgi:cell division protein ZapA (FtsZ GTPase activity inhibitor)